MVQVDPDKMQRKWWDAVRGGGEGDPEIDTQQVDSTYKLNEYDVGRDPQDHVQPEAGGPLLIVRMNCRSRPVHSFIHWLVGWLVGWLERRGIPISLLRFFLNITPLCILLFVLIA